MRKIDRIQLQNFQSHEDATIELAPMLTTIVGPSDSGKSSIIRALRWVFLNEPAGTQYMRVGTQDTFVLITYTDGSSILRARSKSANYYVLKDSEGETTRLEGFGQNVPVEVEEFSGIHKIGISGKDAIAVNLSEQLENAFLLGEKASVRAEAISKLAGTDTIDRAHTIAGKDKFTANRDISQLILREQELLAQMEQYDDLETEKIQIDHFELLLERIEAKEKELLPLQQLKAKYTFVNHRILEEQKTLEQYESLETLVHMVERIELFDDKRQNLSYLFHRMESNDAQTKKGSDILRQLNTLITFSEQAKVAEKSEMYSDLHRAKEKLLNVEQERETLGKYMDFDYNHLISSMQAIENRRQQISLLQSILEKYKENSKRLSIGADFVQKHQSVEIAGANYTMAIESIRLLNVYRELNVKWKQYIQNDERSHEEWKKTDGELKRLTESYIHLFQESGTCPYCLSVLDTNAMEHLERHMMGGDQ